MSTFLDTQAKSLNKGDLLNMITNKNYIVYLTSLSDEKILYELAKEMHFDVKATGNKGTRNRSLIILLNSPAIMASLLSTVFLQKNPNELYDIL